MRVWKLQKPKTPDTNSAVELEHAVLATSSTPPSSQALLLTTDECKYSRVVGASLVDSYPREMPRLFPMLELGEMSQDTSSTIV